MSMSIKALSIVMADRNVEAFKSNASRRAGQMFNDRIANFIAPKLPLMVRGYKDEPWFRFILANAVAGAIIKFGYTNEKLSLLADAGIMAANDEFMGSFNIEEMINELVDGIPTDGLTKAAKTARGGSADILRRAADVVDNERGA